MGLTQSVSIKTKDGNNITNQFSNATKASIKQGVRTIHSTKGNKKTYTIVECNKNSNKKSYTNRFKNMESSVVKRTGNLAKSVKESAGKLGTSVGTWGKKNKQANNKKNNSIKITTKDIKNVEDFFDIEQLERYKIYQSFKENINELIAKDSNLKKIILGITLRKYGFNEPAKLSLIYTEYSKELILKEKPNVQRINNQPKNNQPKNNITNKYDINQQRLIKLFSAVYEYYESTKTTSAVPL